MVEKFDLLPADLYSKWEDSQGVEAETEIPNEDDQELEATCGTLDPDSSSARSKIVQYLLKASEEFRQLNELRHKVCKI